METDARYAGLRASISPGLTLGLAHPYSNSCAKSKKIGWSH